ncbi:hypothetical protein GCM10017673_14500 [Streptosporangium violaceochromogenes]|nr:hypothetical protein GCM10017673_14500 [Streptosporangium violaceochromogenes]
MQNHTISEACKLLGVSRSTINRMRGDGRLKAIRSETHPKGRVLITGESLARFAKARAKEFGKEAA